MGISKVWKVSCIALKITVLMRYPLVTVVKYIFKVTCLGVSRLNLISTDCSDGLDWDRQKTTTTTKKQLHDFDFLCSAWNAELEILVRAMKAESTGNCQCLDMLVLGPRHLFLSLSVSQPSLHLFCFFLYILCRWWNFLLVVMSLSKCALTVLAKSVLE